MRKVFNIWRLDTDGRIMPANNPLASSPDYYTHAQLRYDTFLSPNVIQGTFVTGANSSVAVEIPENKLQWSFKLFVSRDGTTYTEDKTFGGADGIDYTADAFIDAEDFDTGVIGVTGDIGSKVFANIPIPKFGIFKVSQTGVGGYLIYDVNFASSSVGWAVGYSEISGLGSILKTTNSGSSWTLQSSPDEIIYSVRFISTSVGWAVGQGGAIYKTTDGGTNWSLQTSGVSDDIYGVDFVDANNGFAVGISLGNRNLGLVLKTTDGGTNWSVLTTMPDGYNTVQLYTVSAVSSSIVFVGGVIGASGAWVLKTSNGGTNWTTILDYNSVINPIWSIHAVSSTVIYACGGAGTIVKSTDGTTFSEQISATTEDLRAIMFASSTVGWAVGKNGTILNTTNGGTTWTAQTSSTDYDYLGLHVTSTSAAIIGGEGYTILTTSNGGTTWTNRTQAVGRPSITTVWNGLDNELATNSASYLEVGHYSINFEDNWGGSGALVIPLRQYNFTVGADDGTVGGEITFKANTIYASANYVEFYSVNTSNVPANGVLQSALFIIVKLP